jgi:hypothetical protein
LFLVLLAILALLKTLLVENDFYLDVVVYAHHCILDLFNILPSCNGFGDLIGDKGDIRVRLSSESLLTTCSGDGESTDLLN